MINAHWAEIKALIDAGTVEYRHIELSNKYHVLAFDGNFQLTTTFYKGSEEATDYEANYKAAGAARVSTNTKTPLGVPIVAMTKPDGNSKTLISHNFCDKTTWASETDSRWEVVPEAGTRYLLQKAEVQFSHDVQLKTMTPALGEMHSEIFYQGMSLPDHYKIFTSLSDVFDLGNKHYTMNATVDGTPGMTTVVFDYADSISLESIVNMKMVFSVLNDLELGGTHCSVALVVTPEEY